MTDVLKQKIMLIFISFVLLIAIIGFLLLNRSLAWFSLNNQISASGMKVEVLYSDIYESINYYRGTEMQLEGEGDDLYNRYYFSYDPAVLDFKKLDTDTAPERDAFTTPIQMLEYSDLTGSCQILIELKLKNPGTYKIGVSTETEEYLGNMLLEAIAAFETEGAEKIFIPPTGLPLSSVVHFAVLDSEANDSAGVRNDTENKMLSLSDKDITSIDETFVHFTKTDSGTEASFASPFHGHDDNMYPVTVGEDKTLYIFIDYYLPAIEDIIEKTLYYVDSATHYDPGYNDIVIGLTNLIFSTDFAFTIEEVSAQ